MDTQILVSCFVMSDVIQHTDTVYNNYHWEGEYFVFTGQIKRGICSSGKKEHWGNVNGILLYMIANYVAMFNGV